MTSEKENILPSKKLTQDEIPFEDIKNPKPLNRAKTNPTIVTTITEEISNQEN